MINSEIKNIIFDLGGVILDLNLNAAYQAFSELSGLPEEEVIQRTQGLLLFEDYETGAISSGTFRQNLNQLLEMQASDVEIDQAWCAMLGEIPAYRLELVARLRKSYRTFILSNTNEIHVNQFDGILQQAGGNSQLGDHFEKVYYSHEMGLRKPNIEIYQTVLLEQSIAASETLFIDDTLANLKGAEELDIRTFLLEQPQQLIRLFDGAS